MTNRNGEFAPSEGARRILWRIVDVRRQHWLAAAIVGLHVIFSSAAMAQTTMGASTGRPLLPHDLSPWGMFLGADIVVKGILIALATASLLTWTIALAKGCELLLGRRRASRALAAIHAASSLNAARQALGASSAAPSAFVGAALSELDKSRGLDQIEGIKERIGLHLQRLDAAYGRRMMRGTGLLATIGAIAPFVGLFGTVWGIMNSFVNISKLHTTNLAVVAPGIAEALLATAVGLAAAIPAVIVYNLFARGTASYRATLGDASAEVMRLAGRDLDRRNQARAEDQLPASPAHLIAAE